MTDPDPIHMAFPVTVYAANLRYNVRPEFEHAVPPDAKVVFTVDQFVRPGIAPYSADQVLEHCRLDVETDSIGEGVLKGKLMGQVYEFGGNWSYTSTVIASDPCPTCSKEPASATVR